MTQCGQVYPVVTEEPYPAFLKRKLCIMFPGTFWLCSVSPVLTACVHPEYCLTSSGEKPLRDLRAEKRGKMQPTTTLFALYRSLSIEANSKSCTEKASASLWFRAVPGKLLPPTWRKMMSGCLETRHIILFNSAQPFAISRVTVKPPRPQISTEVALSLKSGHKWVS